MKPYRLIAMDPPWNTDQGGGGRGAQTHYPLMPFEDIWRTIMLSGAFRPDPEGCHVWIWYTSLSRQLVPALFQRLGVRDTGHERIWVKGRLESGPTEDGTAVATRLVLHTGLGQYGRSAHEYVRLGIVGDLPVPTAARPPTVFIAPARGDGLRHSQKPSEFYKTAEEMASGLTPRLEMFARTPRAGWDVWGNEVKNDADQATQDN